MKPRLNVIVASTRPGRIGSSIGKWFDTFAKEHGAFDVHLVEIADFNLPVYDEPQHPRLQKYQHEHTKRWAASVDAADAYVFVAPEYNFGPTPALLNALNYVYTEWNYKPAGFVSYGGISGGLRAVERTKQTLTALKVVPVVEAVVLPLVFGQIKDATFTPNDIQKQGGKDMLDELKRWADALKPMREKAA